MKASLCTKPGNHIQTHYAKYTPNLGGMRCLSLGHRRGNSDSSMHLYFILEHRTDLSIGAIYC
jgi:hypothetical protein